MHEDGLQLGGIHHVSALSAHIARSHDFYTRVLGLRPVIRTVNQDDPSMYHLFFGDGVGSPGSDMTVFDMPHAAREHRGRDAVTLTTFRVAGADSLAWWGARLSAFGVPHDGIAERDSRRVLDFDDPEGTRLSLVDDDGVGPAWPWAESPVPAEWQIRGLGYPVITVGAVETTWRFLVDVLGLRHARRYDDAASHAVHVFEMGGGSVAAELHVAVRPDLPRARYGTGGVHHVALRVPEGQRIADWAARLDELELHNTGVVDRHYFASVYVREPHHVLIELATDGPGFEVDGPLDGKRLSLPPFLEPRRAEIEGNLKPIG